MNLDALLQELGSESIDGARLRSEQAFDRIAAPFENRIVIFGTGYLGKLAAQGVRAAGLQPLAFCDNNSQLCGSYRDGIEILSPAEAVARYQDSAAFVVAIYNSTAPRQQLKALGCSRVVPYPVLFWKFSQFMPGED